MATFSKGLEGVVAAQTKLSYIDGEKGVLEYIGIPIGELAGRSSFEETVFFLWNGRLPKKGELAEFTTAVRARYDIPAGVEELLKTLLEKPETSLVVVRQPCVLAAPKIRFYEKAALEKMSHACAAMPAD